MDAAPSPVSTEVTTAMTPGVARALVRIHRVGMQVVAAADRNHEDELAEATGMFVLAFRNYRAKVDVGRTTVGEWITRQLRDTFRLP